MSEETTTEDIVTKTKEYTDQVRTAIYGKEVRSAIADSIDGIAQNVKEEIARDTVLNDLKTGVNGTIYDSAGDAVRGQTGDLTVEIFEKLNIANLITQENISNVVKGYIKYYATGVVSEEENSEYIAYIPVKAGSLYSCNISAHICFFDKNNAFISGTLTNQTYNSSTYPATFLTPANTKTISVSFAIASENTICIVEGSNKKTFALGYNILNNDLSNDNKVLSTRKILDIFYEKGVNIKEFNITDKCFRQYTTGSTVANDSYSMTDYIPCDPETEYKLRGNSPMQICFFDENLGFLSGTLCNQTYNNVAYGNTLTTPESCEYMVVSYMTKLCVEIEKKKETYAREKIYIVDKNGNGDFTSVTEAVENTKNNDIIFVRSGVYDNEMILCDNSKIIHIVGENRLNTIIKNHYADYAKAPICMGAGSLENLTVYSEKLEGQSLATGATAGSYAVHVERHSLANNTLLIKNCILKSDWHVGLGMGMRGGCNILLENNDIQQLYVHDSDYDDYVGVQTIKVRDCRIFAEGTNKSALWLQSQEKEGTIVNATFQNNYVRKRDEQQYGLFQNWYDGVSSDDNDFQGLINWRKCDLSFGNNYSVLNE